MTLTLAIGLSTLLVAAGAARVQGQCEQWLPGNGLPGLDDTARAALIYDEGAGPAMYVGGEFSIAGEVAANQRPRHSSNVDP
jgi:hypothetical protein